jgi:predicted TIM-barrel fold metal-dependent hydrolase
VKEAYNDLLDHINTLEIIDTHEHLPCKEEDRDMEADVLQEYLAHYFNRDLISAGFPNAEYDRLIEEDMSVGDRWKMVEPYWEACRYTGYGRALDITARDIYGVDRIDSSTIEELNNKFEKTKKPGHFKKILKDKCKIKTSLLNVETLSTDYDPREERSIHCDKELYSPVYRVGKLVHPDFWSQIKNIEKQSEVKITSFSSWLEATETMIEKAYEMGAVALKNALAYVRTLRYDRVTRAQAEEEFNRIFSTSHMPDWHELPAPTGKAFQDYMFHFILDIANKKNLVVQIHTGIQEGSGNILSNSNPELLSNLFLEYPDVTFDLFHISYPYQAELTVLAKNFSNVFIDMCWAHIVSPNASVNSLLEWFDTVPLNKISAFGGDYLFIDGVYGHLKLAQQDVAKALAIKVGDGLFDMEKAKEVAGMLFYKNPRNIFKL